MKHEKLNLNGVETDVRVEVNEGEEGKFLRLVGTIGDWAIDTSVPLEQAWTWTGSVGVIIQAARVECGKAMVRELLSSRDELSMRDAAREHRWTPHVLAQVFTELLVDGEVESVRENGKEGPVVRLVET